MMIREHIDGLIESIEYPLHSDLAGLFGMSIDNVPIGNFFSRRPFLFLDNNVDGCTTPSGPLYLRRSPIPPTPWDYFLSTRLSGRSSEHTSTTPIMTQTIVPMPR
jgi:hypothetical protein